MGSAAPRASTLPTATSAFSHTVNHAETRLLQQQQQTTAPKCSMQCIRPWYSGWRQCRRCKQGGPCAIKLHLKQRRQRHAHTNTQVMHHFFFFLPTPTIIPNCNFSFFFLTSTSPSKFLVSYFPDSPHTATRYLHSSLLLAASTDSVIGQIRVKSINTIFFLVQKFNFDFIYFLKIF